MTTGTFLADDAFLVPPAAGGLDGFVRWVQSETCPEDKRFSHIDGEMLVEMSAEKIRPHNWVKNAVTTAITIWADDRDLGQVFADRALLVNDHADLSTEPDVMFCLWSTLRRGRVRLGEDSEGGGIEVTGSPDLVVEIISDSSVGKDTRRLPTRYFAAKIKEYWLIDARGEELEFTIFRRGKSKYNEVTPDDEGFIPSRVLGGRFCLIRELNPLRTYKYRLLSKEI